MRSPPEQRYRCAIASASPDHQHNGRRCAMSYLSKHGTQRLPQWLPLPGQVRNSAGGHAWAVDVWTRLRRFLVLGSEGGSYYASEWKLTRENAKAVEEAVREYRQRAGVTHRDLLRLSHPAARVGAGNPTVEVSDGHARLFEWIVRGGDTAGLPRVVEGFARAQSAATPAEAASLVREFRLPREA